MKIQYLAVGAAFCFCTAIAAQIEIPHQFSAGTPARSAEVNANFATLTEESNAQDSRLTAIESSSRRVSAQLICVFPFGLAESGETTVRCVRDSTPGAKETTTYSAIIAEGWTAVSTGGGTNDLVMLFHQFEAT